MIIIKLDTVISILTTIWTWEKGETPWVSQPNQDKQIHAHIGTGLLRRHTNGEEEEKVTDSLACDEPRPGIHG